MDDRLIQGRLTAALQNFTNSPRERRFPWDDDEFAHRFVKITDENAQVWRPPEPDVIRLLDIWNDRTSHTGALLPSILELACGTGRHSIALAWAGCNVVGVDIGASEIERALEKAQGHKGGNLGFVHADIATYDPGRQFDLIPLLSKQCVTFSAIDLAAIIRHYMGFLTNDGCLILEIPGQLPDPDVKYRKPGEHKMLFSDGPYWEMQLTEVDSARRLVLDRYAVLTEADDLVTGYTNCRTYYTADWIAQMLPYGSSITVHSRRSQLDWCVISNRPLSP